MWDSICNFRSFLAGIYENIFHLVLLKTISGGTKVRDRRATARNRAYSLYGVLFSRSVRDEAGGQPRAPSASALLSFSSQQSSLSQPLPVFIPALRGCDCKSPMHTESLPHSLSSSFPAFHISQQRLYKCAFQTTSFSLFRPN